MYIYLHSKVLLLHPCSSWVNPDTKGHPRKLTVCWYPKGSVFVPDICKTYIHYWLEHRSMGISKLKLSSCLHARSVKQAVPFKLVVVVCEPVKLCARWGARVALYVGTWTVHQKDQKHPDEKNNHRSLLLDFLLHWVKKKQDIAAVVAQFR